MLSFNQFINEEFKLKTKLCQSIWDGENLRPEVRKKLMLIAKDFWKAAKLDVRVADITFTGSLANYNWDQSSDIDLHVLLDFKKINKDQDLVANYLLEFKANWNSTKLIKIKGFVVECYFQNSSEPHISTGVYSVFKNKWLTKPEYQDVKINQTLLDKKVATLHDEVKKIFQLSEDKQLAKLTSFFKKIKNARRRGLASGGELNLNNLVFKQFRRDGTLAKVVDRINRLKLKKYQLNESTGDYLNMLTDDQRKWCYRIIGPNYIPYIKADDYVDVSTLSRLWTVNPNGEIDLINNKVVYILRFAEEALPIQFGICNGTLSYINSRLNSLKGSPSKVKNIFTISNCRSIESLDYSPNSVNQYIIKGLPKLKNLKGISKTISDLLVLDDCTNLSSLDGLSADILRSNIYANNCAISEEELISNWENGINQDEVDQFKSDWEI